MRSVAPTGHGCCCCGNNAALSVAAPLVMSRSAAGTLLTANVPACMALVEITGAMARGLAKMDLVIALSEFSRDKHREGGVTRPMAVLPNFVPDQPAPVEPFAEPHGPARRRPYFLFVGRFIPDKGLQYLVPAFERLQTSKKLVLVGGAPNPSDFERRITGTRDKRIVLPGYVYGSRTHALMRNAYAYVQPSDIEGLSPVILENMGLGTPIICSDIPENRYVVADTGAYFRKSDPDDLLRVLQWALANAEALAENGQRGKARARAMFSWDAVAEAFERVFADSAGARHRAPPAAASAPQARERAPHASGLAPSPVRPTGSTKAAAPETVAEHADANQR